MTAARSLVLSRVPGVWKRSTCLKMHLALVPVCVAFLYLCLARRVTHLQRGVGRSGVLIHRCYGGATRPPLADSAIVLFSFSQWKRGPATVYVGTELLSESWLPF